MVNKVLKLLCMYSVIASLPAKVNANQAFERNSAPPKICLVLAGGGALGIVHVGVLKYLEEQRIPVHCIAGTSMGSIVGGLYASGYTANELEILVKSTDWLDMFDDSAPRNEKSYQRKLDDFNFLVKYQLRVDDSGNVLFPRGVISGNKIDLSFLEFTLRSRHVQHFDDLPIPYRAIAVDVETGNEVILSNGSLARAMKASMSIPGVFPPTEIDNKMLIDGGIANNLPIDVARSLGADVVIAVNIPADLKKKEELTSAFEIAQQVSTLLLMQNINIQLKMLKDADVLITPNIKGYTSSSFDKTAELIEPGYIAAKQALAELKKYAISDSDYALLRQRQIIPKVAPEIISFIEIDNQSGINNALIQEQIESKIDQALDTQLLKQDLITLSGLGYFDKVLFEIAEREEQTGLIVSVFGPGANKNTSSSEIAKINEGTSIESPPNSLQFGIALEDDFNGESEYNLGLRYKRIPVTSNGGELIIDLQTGDEAKLQVSLFQPIDEKARYFFTPLIGYQGQNIPFFQNGEQLVDYRLHQGTIGVDFGRRFGNVAELRAGIRRGIAYADLITGRADFDIGNFDTATYFISAAYDDFDSVDFPKQGLGLEASLSGSIEELGANEEFQNFEFNLSWADSWDKNTLVLTTSTSLNLEDEATLEGQFFLGGFGNLSGYKRGELVVNNFMFNRVSFYHEWSLSNNSFFEVPLYTGISLESAGIFTDKDDIFGNDVDYIFAGSIFLGAQTVLGPIYLGYGISDDDNQSFYLFVGRNL